MKLKKKNPTAKEKKINEEKIALFKKVISLPYLENIEQFENSCDSIMKNQYLLNTEKDYLTEKLTKKEQWAKCFIVNHFTTGITTTSRVECFNACLKKKLRSDCRLVEVIELCKNYQLEQDKDDIDGKITQKDRKTLLKFPIMIEIAKLFTKYAVDKICCFLSEGLPLTFTSNETNSW